MKQSYAFPVLFLTQSHVHLWFLPKLVYQDTLVSCEKVIDMQHTLFVYSLFLRGMQFVVVNHSGQRENDVWV